MKISIFIINYNNEKLLSRSIKSAQKQTYKNFEIIVYDDFSNDNSKKEIKKFKGIKKIFLKKKIFFGAYGQINGIVQCLKKCNGDIVCFLDSDDYFHKDKLKKIFLFFKNNKQINIATDLPIYSYTNKKIKKIYFKYNLKRFFNWPKFAPQSCISVRTDYLKKNINLLTIKKFNHIWFDFRILILQVISNNLIGTIDNYLTFYQQSHGSISSKYLKFNKNWWKRRSEAFDYIDFLKKKRNIKNNFFISNRFFTKLINLLLG